MLVYWKKNDSQSKVMEVKKACKKKKNKKKTLDKTEIASIFLSIHFC